jgi:peptide/nickel transport system permease protein
MIDRERAEARAVPRISAGVLAPVLSPFQAVASFSRRKPLGAVGGGIILVLILIAALAQVISPFPPLETHADLVHKAPSATFPLGTDHVGRDVMSRIIHGAQISLYVGFTSVLIGVTAGFVLGVVTAYAGGAFDLALQRLVDALMTLPGLIIALAIMAVLGSSLNNVIIAIIIGMLAPVIRTVRSQVLTLKELDYVLAARAVGASPLRIVFRHITPNCMAIVLVVGTYYLGLAIIIEASLSFLGVGSPPDVPSWGGMLSRAVQEHVKTAPWVAMFPGLAIFILVFGFNLLGDALRDVFDPKLRGR